MLRCVQKGMNVGAIADRNPDELRCYSENLRSILLSQRSTFVNRYAVQLKACGGNSVSLRYFHILLSVNQQTCI